MSPGKGLASWSDRFRIDIFYCLRFLIQRFQTHCSPCKVKIDAKVLQKVTAEYATLRKPCRFIYRFHIQHCRVDLLERAQTKTQFGQLQQLHVFSDTRSTEHTHL